jgi:hypothetical protein
MKKTEPKRKSGPQEQLHTLQPFTFKQALGAILKAKPSKDNKKAAKKKTR